MEYKSFVLVRADNGAPLPLGKLWVYLPGTTTPVTVYDLDGVTTVANPVVADSGAVVGLSLPDGVYDMVPESADSAYVGPRIKRVLFFDSSNIEATITSSMAPLLSEAAASVAAAADVRDSLLTQRAIPVGWVEPTEYTGVTLSANPLGIKLWSDGFKIWTMMQDVAATLTGWRVSGGPVQRFPDTNTRWVAVHMSRVLDPILQGSAFTTYDVNITTGNDTTGDGSAALPWRTVPKALTVINTAAGKYWLRVTTPDYISGNAQGWDPTSYTFNPGVEVLIEAMPTPSGKRPWWIPGARRSYSQATFAFSHIGSNMYKCTTGSISAATKNTPITYDLSVLNEFGGPTPGESLTGTLADDAAVLAAADGRPINYYRSSDTTQYLRLASGAAPNPGVNYAYVENQAGISFLMDTGSRVKLKGFNLVHNTSVVPGGGIQVRPKNLTLGPSAPLVDHDIRFCFEDCGFFGMGGNAIIFMDVGYSAVKGCSDGEVGLDGVNQSTFYTPGNSNSTVMAANQWCFVDDHVSWWHGPNGFKDQPTVNTSANTFTTHSRGNMVVTNSVGGFSNGSGIAVVGGAKCLAVNVNCIEPRFVSAGADVYPASLLASGNSAYNTSIPSEIAAIHCTGSSRPSGRTVYVGPTAKMTVVNFNGQLTKQVDSGGSLTNGYGVAL